MFSIADKLKASPSSIRAQPLIAATFLVAALLCVPIIIIISSVFTGSFDIWQHLRETLLAEYLFNSLLLMLGVGIGVLLIGVSTAWLTSIYDFPLRKLFIWALLLPMAMPAYIIAYTYTGLLDFAGPVQSSLRGVMGWEYGDYWFFDIRSLPGASVMLTLVLYPYVFLMARAAFLEQSQSIVEASRTLGYGGRRALFKLTVPMARPAIIAGLSLALMETLADYGTVQYFGVNTFTTAIFRTFYGFGDTNAAAQLAAMLLSIVFLLILLERYSRRRVRYHTKKGCPLRTLPLKKTHGIMAIVFCSLPILLGFVIPATQLLYWTLLEASVDWDFLVLAWNSFYLALLAAVVSLVLALLLAYSKRIYGRWQSIRAAVSLAGMGYALPGTIVAVGVLIPMAWFDQHLIVAAKQWFNWDVGLLLSGTLVALLFAYSVRFLAVALGAVNSGLQQIRPNIDNAARLMGYRPVQVLRKIHVPLLRTSAITAFLIVFVDVLKELPVTLILRPFDFNTLAVRAYELASDERLVDAAPASLLIVLVGLAPVILLSRSIKLSSHSDSG